MSSYQYRKSFCGDKAVVRSSCFHSGHHTPVRWHIYIESVPWYRADDIPLSNLMSNPKMCFQGTRIHKVCIVWGYGLHQYTTTSSNGNICLVIGPLCGGFTGHRWIPAQRPVTRNSDVFYDMRLNKRLSKQWWGWLFETPSRSLWRHCNDEPGFPNALTRDQASVCWMLTLTC